MVEKERCPICGDTNVHYKRGCDTCNNAKSFAEIIPFLEEGLQCVNLNWNGIHLPGRIMYIKLQKPDENSLNTEPYIMFYSGEAVESEVITP